MVNQRPHSPKIAPQTPEKSAPQVESETLLLVPPEEVLETKTSRQPMSRRRRASSRTNRDDRKHQVRRYKTGGSTYRPNYDALPERRREYREYPERSMELEPMRQESYQEYSSTSETYKNRFKPGYPHDDYTWERRPFEYRDYYDNRKERICHQVPEYSRTVSSLPTSQSIPVPPASTLPLELYDYDPRAYRNTVYRPSDRDCDYYYMDRLRRPIYDYSRPYRSPLRHDYYYETVRPVNSVYGDSGKGYRPPTQNSSRYIGYQHTNMDAGGSHNYHYCYPDETSRQRDRSPGRSE